VNKKIVCDDHASKNFFIFLKIFSTVENIVSVSRDEALDHHHHGR